MNLENTYLKPCPFCGSDVDSYKDSADFIHPASKDKTVWQINCCSVYGGCDASILGDSPEDCIEKWDKRFDEFDFEDYDTIWGEDD